ncbi:MAG: DUF192 domain-containing protein [Candidatus Omnitrophota bacterium]
MRFLSIFRNKIILGSIIALGLFFAIYSAISYFPFEQVCFSDTCLHVELASTPQERSQGLMFRHFLPQDRGMLFIFEEDDYWAFWMKNTYVPLDMIWLDANRQVVHIIRNALPAKGDIAVHYVSAIPARYVVEAAAGFCEKNNIKLGQQAKFKWIFLPKKI